MKGVAKEGGGPPAIVPPAPDGRFYVDQSFCLFIDWMECVHNAQINRQHLGFLILGKGKKVRVAFDLQCYQIHHMILN